MAAKPHRQGTKPADPALEEGRERDPLRPFGVPRWAGLLLFALFWFLLLIPLVRRWRRRSWWGGARIALALAGVVWIAWAWSAGERWLAAPGALLLTAALLLGPADDPDRERKLQRRHRADYLLNGGVFAGGPLPNSEPLQGALFLLIRDDQLLLVPRQGPGEVHSAISIRRIERITVDGEIYRPIYVSEAKDPPVKEDRVDQRATSELRLELDGGKAITFRYQGAFHKHLAETAAHAVHSVREQIMRPQPAELSRILS